MSRRVFLLGAALALAIPIAFSQSMYKWVDEKGITHFSETPPPDGTKGATRIEVRTPQPDKPPGDNWKQRDIESRQLRAKQGIEEEKARQQEEAQRPRNCDNAKRRYDQLTSPRALYSLDAKGERVFMDEKERGSQLEQAKADVARHCR